MVAVTTRAGHSTEARVVLQGEPGCAPEKREGAKQDTPRPGGPRGGAESSLGSPATQGRKEPASSCAAQHPSSLLIARGESARNQLRRSTPGRPQTHGAGRPQAGRPAGPA